MLMYEKAKIDNHFDSTVCQIHRAIRIYILMVVLVFVQLCNQAINSQVDACVGYHKQTPDPRSCTT